ncbi:unnamed protein product [Adineta ricciae]|uniref:Uncharacterized protein n=1 Tax=Adineta ricciae TaxID=249248 RepID=A0A815Q7S9_ADIRI|nr:unnamed protein product [Adineta ricciae]
MNRHTTYKSQPITSSSKQISEDHTNLSHSQPQNLTTRESNGANNNSNNPQQQQEETTTTTTTTTRKKKKKKSRGDRKRQRYVAKLYKQGLTKTEVDNLRNQYNKNNQGQSNEQTTTISYMEEEFLVTTVDQEPVENEHTRKPQTQKRRGEKRSRGINMSMSQMSISDLSKKRQRTTTMNNINEQADITQSTTDTIQLTMDSKKPKYLQVDNEIFKKMLTQSSTEAEAYINQLLDTSEKLDFVRTYAHLLSNSSYWKFEENYWKHYHTECTTGSIWSSPLETKIVKENNLCRFKFKTEIQLNKHQKLINDRIQELENKLNQHKQKSIHTSFDMDRLLTIITAFVTQGQKKLAKEFEDKKLLLQYDVKDNRCVKRFYDMSPTQDQICLAKIIWQATREKLKAEEKVAILKQRIYTKRLPASFVLLDHSIDNMEQMLKQPIFNEDKRAELSYRRSKTIAQF